MAFLYFVAGAVIGLGAGWLVWGRKASAEPADSAAAAQSTKTTTATESVAATPVAAAASADVENDKGAETPVGAAGEGSGKDDEVVVTASTADSGTKAEPVAADATQVLPTPAAVEERPAAVEERPAAVEEPVAVSAADETQKIAVGESPTTVIPSSEPTEKIAADDSPTTVIPTSEATQVIATPATDGIEKPVSDGDKDETVTAAVPGADEAEEVAATPSVVTVAGGTATEPVVAAVPGVDEAEEVAAVPAPVGVTEPDDLTKIAGIGPKAAMALAAGGITTYRQLADSDVAALRAALVASGMRAAASMSAWPERAKQLLDTSH